ncbi:MAG: 5-dehydro-4-deoxy-D-glucuronate isomerase [Micromonosporaceae bacterium]
MEIRHATHPEEFAALDTAGLRRRFLVEELFADGEVRLVYGHHDRLLLGGVRPAGGTVELPVPDQLRVGHFCERRELGVVCLDGSGEVLTDDTKHPMTAHDVLYVGRGTQHVAFTGDASFYLVSTPAHADHPTTLARRDEVEAVALGEPAAANVRTIRKYVHADGIASCQLILGITSLAEGSVWNTMPCHTHQRRTEAYLYFDLDPAARVMHLCGPPDATRSMIVADRQAVISPPWSVHCGAGTANYAFVWAMGGENLDYTDLDMVPIEAMA